MRTTSIVSTLTACGAALFLTLGLAARGRADSIVFKDGRFYEVPKIEEAGDHVTAIFKHGPIVIDKSLLQDWYAISAAGEFTPRNDADKERLAKGLVPFEGRWMPKAARDQAIDKRNKERRAELDEMQKHKDWRNRYQETSSHFAFEYTVPPPVAKNYMDLFEAYYDVFSKEWGVRQPSGKRLKVCFYQNEDDFHRIGNVSPGILGYFRFVEPIELNIFYSSADEALTLAVLFHETNHYLFHLYTKSNYALPGWVEEGLAEYYGASLWDPVSKKMTVGTLQEGRLVNLKDAIDGGDRQGLRDLLSIADVSPLQYAWSWSFCHMLMENPSTRQKFKTYVKKLATDSKLSRETWPRNPNYIWVNPNDSIELFQKTMGVKDLDELEKEWYAYIEKMNVVSDRGYHDAAMFCMRWQRWLRAKLYFEKAVSLYSKNPNTYMQYGRLLIQLEKPDDAIKALETGLKIDPMNPYFYKELGAAYRAKGDDASIKHGKGLQLLAWELDPNDPRLIDDFDTEMLTEVTGS